MMTEQQMRMMMEMFSNPMFKQGANEFLKIAQQQGIEAANNFGAFHRKAKPSQMQTR